MKQIPLTQGYYAIVDDEDYDKISKYRWYWNSHGAGYACRKVADTDGKVHTLVMHRAIMDAPPTVQIDHVNGNGLDNRKANLRYANVQLNSFNRRKPNVPSTSRYKGVLQRKGANYWLSRIKYNDHHVELGRFESEEIAASAYNFASKIFFGEFRKENELDMDYLSDELKEVVFRRCRKKIHREGWIIENPTYITYNEIFNSADCSRVFS